MGLDSQKNINFSTRKQRNFGQNDFSGCSGHCAPAHQVKRGHGKPDPKAAKVSKSGKRRRPCRPQARSLPEHPRCAGFMRTAGPQEPGQRPCGEAKHAWQHYGWRSWASLLRPGLPRLGAGSYRHLPAANADAERSVLHQKMSPPRAQKTLASHSLHSGRGGHRGGKGVRPVQTSALDPRLRLGGPAPPPKPVVRFPASVQASAMRWASRIQARACSSIPHPWGFHTGQVAAPRIAAPSFPVW